jgi:D-3-phosphoglycerate dehydrogenase
MGRQLAGSTLGVIGYGVIGQRLAQVGDFLGMQVLVSDPYKTVDDPALRQVELDALLASSDFVVCLAIANEATENLIDAAALARMQPHAYFVNVSRGGLVDEAALAAALDAGQIAGAAMDVGRAADQKPSLALASRADVVATPHIGGATPPAIAHQALETVRQVAEIVQGRAPEGAANADSATKLARLAGGR